MGQYEKEIVSRLKEFDQIPKSAMTHDYCLTHTYDEENRKFYVESPYDSEEFEAICAYIQFECSEVEESYAIDQTEVIEILEKFYDCKQSQQSTAAEIDLYENWEYFCGSDVQSVECLKRDGMNDYFKKYVENFYEANPKWRPEAQ